MRSHLPIGMGGLRQPAAAGAAGDGPRSLWPAGIARGGLAPQAGIRPADPAAKRSWCGRPDGPPHCQPDLRHGLPRCPTARRRPSRALRGDGAGDFPMAGARPQCAGVRRRWQRGWPSAPSGVIKDSRLAVGLVQMDPALGDRARNLERHRQWVRQAATAGVELLVFPELSLTGYFLKDLVAESAISLQGAVMDELRGLSDGLDVVLGAVIEDPDHRYFNASLYFSRGELVHVHRKV